MTHNSDYLNKIVFLRKGTNLVLPVTEANQKDPNLVPMKVSEAIQLGYIKDPMQDKVVDPAEKQLQDENNRLRELLQASQEKQSQSDLALSQMKQRLDDIEAVTENKVSVGKEVPESVESPKVTGEVTPPEEGVEIVNMALDADETGLENADETVDEVDDTQAQLDQLFEKGSET